MSSLVEYEDDYSLDADPQPNAGKGDDSALQTNLLSIAWQARWLLLLTVLLGVGCAWLYLQRVVPRYTSVSRIYVERSLPQIFASDAQRGTSSSYLYTQAELITSTPVLAAAANAPESSQLETFRSTDNPIGLLKKNLSVQVGKNDDIINVMIELPSAEDAAQIVNSVVDAYISKYAEERRTDTVEVLNILRNEKQRRDAELEQRIEALEKFRGQNAALAVQVGEENVITKRFAALASELDRVELALLDSKARHNRTQQMLESPSLRPFLLELASGQQSVAQDISLENRLQVDLEKQIQDIQLQIDALRATWGDGHTRVKLALQSKAAMEERLAKQLEATEERKKAIVSAYVETVSQEHQLLEQKREELQRSYDKQFKLAMQVNSQAAKLTTLENSLARTVRDVDRVDEQIKGINLTEDVGAMNVSIMEVARASSEPTYPIPARFLAIGALLGGLTGFGLAWLRDLMDHRLKSIEEIAATLQLPVLGALPLSAGKDDRHETGRVVLTHPRSMAAESFRTLRTAIHFGLTRDDAKVIAITSPSPGDGKSVVASNLALTMAQADQRVLLIDADMRKPKQHEVFEIQVEHGLSSVLAERRPADEVIQRTEVDTLDLLPCGSRPTNPVELLNNGYFSELLHELQQKYDKIVIDSPPVMPVADARVISAQTDATILVLRADCSTRRMSVAARDELWRVRAQRIGIVVNAVPGRKQANYSQGYGYGYGNYGHSSGTYGDLAYGEPEPPVDISRRKKSRARSQQLPSPEATSEAMEPLDI
ncbi:polysaccharide biosynthesis tyrosine autokinase [Adhaeretor mobilis]|uniref:non-specific protein-tyrosine kinase n=1 Tax=Adhaeretor mobilis TaxID=1930276 RepID=A0A517MPZ6_9BACT|nr:polysaccharide biosynthesis tyrosine autokinase [Adhaeretor mobilis]QDS96944.1 Tyrosine-protein kinase YwqD [Adhaeretor mobilis]